MKRIHSHDKLFILLCVIASIFFMPPNSTMSYSVPFYAGERNRIIDIQESTVKSESENDQTNSEAYVYESFPFSDYAYNILDEDFQYIYNLLYKTIISENSGCELFGITEEDLEYIFYCVDIDHPELYYINGFTYTSYTENGEITKIVFNPSYIYSVEERKKFDEDIKREIAQIIADAPINSSFDTVKYVYDYIIDNTTYNLKSADNQNIISVFLNKESVCQGYAKAAQLLLLSMDIDCTLVTGVVNKSENHAWNMLSLEGDYYFLDATWGDSSYGQTGQTKPMTDYYYLNATSKDMATTHTLDNRIPIPECMATKYNYFIYSGTYLDLKSPEVVKNMFQTHSISNGEVSIKCASKDIYDWLCKELKTGSNIFNYTNYGSGTINYLQDDSELTFTVWAS